MWSTQGKVTDSPVQWFGVHRLCGFDCGSQVVCVCALCTCRSKCVFQCLRGTQCDGNIVLSVCVCTVQCVCLCVTPVVLLESMVTSAGVSKWQGLFVGVVICSEKSGTDSWWRQQEGATTSTPPPNPNPTQNVISSLAGSPNHPHEKNRHLKLCDMCQRRCHWATAADVARIDSTRAAGAGLGTYRVWWVSVPILVRASSQAAPQI